MPEADAQRRNQNSDENLAEDFAAIWHPLMASEESQRNGNGKGFGEEDGGWKQIQN